MIFSLWFFLIKNFLQIVTYLQQGKIVNLGKTIVISLEYSIFNSCVHVWIDSNKFAKLQTTQTCSYKSQNWELIYLLRNSSFSEGCNFDKLFLLTNCFQLHKALLTPHICSVIWPFLFPTCWNVNKPGVIIIPRLLYWTSKGSDDDATRR